MPAPSRYDAPMPADLAIWKHVASPAGADLVDAAAAADAHDVAAVARLRRRWPAEAVRVALQLAEARKHGVAKFGDHAGVLVADPVGVQQASSHAVALHKARRFAGAGAASVIDLCCGIGGDAMGLRTAGLDVLAIDRDPVRAWMAGVNAACSSVACDATAVDAADAWVHIDPARRDGRGRIFKLADYAPPPQAVAALLRAARGGAVKLSPGVDLADLAEALPAGEVEFVSEAGRLVQAVLWTGGLSRGARTATRIDGDAIATISGQPAAAPWGELERFLHTIDPAVERADLSGPLAAQHGLTAPHPKLGLLTGPAAVASPWLTAFELLDRLPWRQRHVKRWLARHHAGLVEVKTRGKAVDPDAAQPALSGSGDQRFTVFVLRFDTQADALMTRRVDAAVTPPS